MSPIQELHAQAMNKAELAELAKLRGEKSAQQDLLYQAYELEYQKVFLCGDRCFFNIS